MKIAGVDTQKLMGRLRDIFPSGSSMEEIKSIPKVPPQPEATAKQWYGVIEEVFDGEQNPGELGNPTVYCMNHAQLAIRSWQIYAENDIARIVVNSMVEWVIGDGLKLQAEPDKDVIKKEGYNLSDTFVEDVESRFRIMAKSKMCSHSKQDTFNQIQRKIYKTAIISGDCLVVTRIKNKIPTVEVIDGQKIVNPYNPYEQEKARKRGNKIVHGVEIKSSGEHVAYHVLVDDYKTGGYTTKRIPAVSAAGRMQATMYYGDQYRIDSVRGIPVFSASIEKMKKIGRYIDATIGAVEERAKVPWTIEHNHFSNGEDPMVNAIRQGEEANVSPADLIQQGDKLASKVALTEGKKVYNLPIGASFKAISSATENNMADFVDNNFIYICAAVGMPYEIALMKFVNSYSASRMASQSWQIIMDNRRSHFTQGVIQEYYNLFLYIQTLLGKIEADGMVDAIKEQDVILMGAYTNCRFIGKNVPQADPSKEVKAEVLKLQNYLTTFDKVSEILGSGDARSNVKKLGKEYELIKEYIPDEFITQANPESDSAELGDDPGN